MGLFVVRETDRLQLGEDCPDKNAGLDPEQHPIGVVGNPDARAPKFLCSSFTPLADLFKLRSNLIEG